MAIKYKWLAQQLRKQIYDNMENGIPKLPTEKELCDRYRVSRQTVRQSLALLEQEGLISRRQGSGSYITGLKSGSNVVAALVTDEHIAPCASLLGELRSALSQRGFSLSVHVTGNRTFDEREILVRLLESPPRALLAEGVKSALPSPNLDLYRRLRALGVPMVFLRGGYGAFPQEPCIKDDNLGGSALLTRHLLEQGHREIGGIFRMDDQPGLERYQGFMEAMHRAGYRVMDRQICWYASGELEELSQGRPDFLRKMAAQQLQGCTAVLCHDDEIAYWLSRELQLPGGELSPVAIAACESTYAGTGNMLAFTTLERRPRQLANALVQAVTDRPKGRSVPSRELPLELAVRESTRRPPEIN